MQHLELLSQRKKNNPICPNGYSFFSIVQGLVLCAILALTTNSQAQTCTSIPGNPTATIPVPSDCEESTTNIANSGAVLELQLQLGQGYSFELCYDAQYPFPDVNTPMLQLWTATNGTILDFINEAPGMQQGCATILFEPCTPADETVYLLPYSHSCVPNWKAWNLTVTARCCALQCPTNVHVNATNGGCQAAAFAISNPTLESACVANTLSYTISPALPNTPTPDGFTVHAGATTGQYAITWTIQDCSANNYTCSQFIFIDPILACNDLVHISLNNSGLSILTPDMVLENYSEMCNAEFNVLVFSTNNVPYQDTLDCSLIGQNVRYEIHHIASNTRCEGNLLIEDKNPPSLLCDDITINCNQTTDTLLTGMPNIYDNCDLELDLIYTDVYNDLNCNDANHVAFIDRTWTAIDDFGNSNSCLQQIFIRRHDINEVVFPADTLVECATAFTHPDHLGFPLLADSSIQFPCNFVSYFEDDTTYNCQGNYKIIRQWTVTDWCISTSRENTQLIEVIDTTGPIIICPFDLTFTTSTNDCTASVTLPTPSITDACSSNNSITASWIFGNGITTYDNIPVGEYELTYTATDDCNNKSTCITSIQIVDKIAPVAICESFTQVALPLKGSALICHDNLDSGSYDNCAVDKIQIAREGDTTFSDCVILTCFDVGNILHLTLQITDTTGLTNQCVAEVEVVDKAAPIINCPPDLTLSCLDDATDFIVTGSPSVIDNCGINISSSDEVLLDICQTGMIIRTWTATDASGNSSFCEQVIHVVDTTAAIYRFFGDTTIICDPLTNNIGRPIVEDDCSLFSTGFNDLILLNEPCFQKIQRTWTIMNECTGAEVSQNMIIKISTDTIAPAFLGVPNDLTIECDQTIPDFDPVIMDICDDDLIIEMTEVIEPGDCPNAMRLTRTWSATDNCGNVGSFTQTIVVEDSTPPSLSAVPQDLTLNCNDSIPNDSLIITDNCDTASTLLFQEVIEVGDCADEQTINRIWTLSDACGNEAVFTQVISIQDTIAPVFLGIPSDTIISCTAVIPNTTPAVMDNCSSNIVVDMTETIETGSCANEDIITRTFTASDACGNSILTTQTIMVVDDALPLVSNIPPDTTIECDQILPFVIPIVTDACGSDFALVEMRDTVGDACSRIITRTWIATDACGNLGTNQQVVTIEDTNAPVFTLLPINSDVTIFLDCSREFILPTPIAIDNCQEDIDIITMIDFYSDGVIYNDDSIRNDTTFVNGNASGIYPLGIHILTFTAQDSCGNARSDQRVIRLTENRPPNISCNSLTIEMPQDTLLTIKLDTITDLSTSIDICTDVSFMFENLDESVVIQNDTLFFTCEHLGVNPYLLIASDEFGNTASCSNVINITDIEGDCGANARPAPAILGRIFTEHSEMVGNVDIQLNDINFATSDENGLYLLKNTLEDSSCIVKPISNEEPLNGVSTYDLVLISQHILGINLLDSPYQLLAADANQDGTISTFDIIQLRQLILYIITELPNNQAWRFVDANYVFPQGANPLEANLPEERVFTNMTENQLDVNFVAIKIGDVSGDVQLQAPITSENRTAIPKRTLVCQDAFLAEEEGSSANFYMQEIDDILGCQFTLHFDPTLVSFEGLEAGSFLQMANIGTSLQERGILTVSWHKTTEIEVQQALLKIRFKAKKACSWSRALRLHSDYTLAEAYSNDGELNQLKLAFSEEIEAQNTSVQTSVLELYQNQPNPFVQTTYISFQLSEACHTQLQIFDLAGRAIYNRNQYNTKGYNEIEITSNEFSEGGIYFYTLTTPFGKATRKMVLIQ